MFFALVCGPLCAATARMNSHRITLAAGLGWLFTALAAGLVFGPYVDDVFPEASDYFWNMGGSTFHIELVGFSITMAGAALVTAWTRSEDDVWNAMRSSKARTAKLSLGWSALSLLTLGFPIWDNYATPRSGSFGKGFYVFLAMLLLAAAYTVARLIAEFRPRKELT